MHLTKFCIIICLLIFSIVICGTTLFPTKLHSQALLKEKIKDLGIGVIESDLICTSFFNDGAFGHHTFSVSGFAGYRFGMAENPAGTWLFSTIFAVFTILIFIAAFVKWKNVEINFISPEYVD